LQTGGVVLTKGSPIIQQIMDETLQHHQAGRLIEAARGYERILKLDPDHGDSLHLLGMISFQARRPDIAIDLIQRAIAIDASFAPYHSNLGTIFQAQGRLDEAEAEYKLALSIDPMSAETLGNFGSVLLAKGEIDDAATVYQRAIAVNPGIAELHFHLGNAQHAQNSLEDAVSSYSRALALREDYAEAHTNLGSVLTDLKRLDQAIVHIEHALAINPGLAEAHNALGVALQAQNAPEQAMAHYEQALRLKPDYAEAHSNYGTLLETQGNLKEALRKHSEALNCTPDYPEGHNNLGNVLGTMGSLDEAIAHYERALALKPELIDARHNLAMAQLCAGDFAAGWRNYEGRWHIKNSPLKRRSFSQPQWHGEPLNGDRILLHAEQGLGDTIQFLRYVPLVQAAGGTVLLIIQDRLRSLAAELPGIADLISSGDALPSFDWHCPLLSLPLAFNTTLGTIPARSPYLSIPQQAREAMDALSWPDDGLRIGLAWKGNLGFLKDKARWRSIPLSLLQPLAEIRDVHLFSLQIGDAVTELTELSGTIADLSPHVEDMADTAAQMTHLDLVITVDTAVAHLAGALGIPTWVLLPFSADWRWQRTRTDSPWYPSMRLFRQPMPGDWESVVEELCAALRQGVVAIRIAR
jgi:tetratricopeptide (TPR) repeat protein